MKENKKSGHSETIAFSAVVGLKSLYAGLGIKLSPGQAEEVISQRLRNSKTPDEQFWDENPELIRREDCEYFLDDGSFWPCLVAADVETGIVKEIFKFGKWVRPAVTHHAIKRFLQYSARIGRHYSTKEEARNDLLLRFVGCRVVRETDLSNEVRPFSKYPGSLYGLEDSDIVKVPLIFAIRPDIGRKHQESLLVVTCYFFQGVAASRPKPKSRNNRARIKMSLRRLLHEPWEEDD